jgi:hypothetical protein
VKRQALVTQQQLDQLKQQITAAETNADAKSTMLASTIFTGGIDGCDGIVAAGTCCRDFPAWHR